MIAKFERFFPNALQFIDMHGMHMISVGFRISSNVLEKLNDLVKKNPDLNTNRSEIVNIILWSVLKKFEQPQLEMLRSEIIETRKNKLTEVK